MHFKKNMMVHYIFFTAFFWAVGVLPTVSIIAEVTAAPFFGKSQELKQTGSLWVATYPSGAKIRIEDKLIGTTPTYLAKLPVGKLTISLEKEGYPVRKKTVDIKAGKGQKLHLTMVDSIPGVLDIRSIPEMAEWSIDGKIKGVTPQFLDKIPAGMHQVTINKPGYHEWMGSFEAKNGHLTIMTIKLRPKEYKLTVLTEPQNAKVEFLDGSEKYTPGMLMKPGKYEFWISAPGYEQKKGRVTLKDRDWVGLVHLKKLSKTTSKSLAKKSTKPKKLTYEPIAVTPKQKTTSSGKKTVKNREKAVVSTVSNKAKSTLNTDKISVASLLTQVQNDVRNGRLLSPVGNNAKEKLQQILKIEPDNSFAKKRLKKVNQLAKSGYLTYVRIFPISEKRKAERYVKRIKALDLPAFLLPTTVKGQPYFRVCSGLFVNRNKAVKARDKMLANLGVKEVVLRRYRASLFKP
ncbi:MAG: PEGA domain-containing protein [Magnetococcales bacterium]|nr:PEGA domain-containing protein [Magnetococcales bacterium]